MYFVDFSYFFDSFKQQLITLFFCAVTFESLQILLFISLPLWYTPPYERSETLAETTGDQKDRRQPKSVS